MNSFDEMAIAYDRSINWKKRLEREIPFILNSLGDRQSARVLDLACGSGRHSIALAEHGLAVIGIDKSDAMIQEAHTINKDLELPIEFIVADMLEIDRVIRGKFDLIMCLGNSLALLDGINQVRDVINIIHERLKDDGAFVFQVLNFQSIMREKFAYFPIKGVYESGEIKYLFARFFQHHTDSDFSTLVMTSFKKEGTDWDTIMASQRVLRLNKHLLLKILVECDFQNIEFYSDYYKHEFEPDKDRSIIVRAHKT